MTIYGFVKDEVVFSPTLRSRNLATLDINCGFIDRQLIEHFMSPLEVSDLRPNRLPIFYRASGYSNIPAEELAAYTAIEIVTQGQNILIQSPDQTVTYGQYSDLNNAIYEAEVLPEVPTIIIDNQMGFIFDDSKITVAEQTAITNLLDVDYNYIFNIVEYLLYGTIPTDTLSDINTVLFNDPKFTNYIDGTVNVSNLRTAVELFDGLNIHRFAPRWIQFRYNKSGTILDFKFWFDRNDFSYLYPLTTITKVMSPLTPANLLNSSAITDPLAAVSTSSALIAGVLSADITNEDHSGYTGFTTRYVFNNTEHLFTFGLLYRGRHPSIFEVRDAIVNYLLTSGVGDEAIWRVRFPDIFVENRFFMIPIWSNSTEMINNDIYPSIISNKAEDALIDGFMNNIIEDPQEYENLTVAYDKFFIATLADTGNSITSIKALHPTYQDFSSTEPGFANMQQATQDFSILINQALAVASGEENNVSYTQVIIDGKTFVSIVLNDTEYLILRKDSYLANLPA